MMGHTALLIHPSWIKGRTFKGRGRGGEEEEGEGFCPLTMLDTDWRHWKMTITPASMCICLFLGEHSDADVTWQLDGGDVQINGRFFIERGVHGELLECLREPGADQTESSTESHCWWRRRLWWWLWWLWLPLTFYLSSDRKRVIIIIIIII